MEIGTSDVSSKSAVIGQAKYPVFDTWDEVFNEPTYGLGEVKALELLNSQIKTNAMNEVRTIKTKGPSKTGIRNTAMNEIVQEIANQEHGECIGDQAALTALIDRRAAEIEARMKAATPELVGAEDDIE